MENASKALIIAGAILISIVLITLGVVILGQGQDVVNSSNMDATAIQSWNSQFTQYQGDKVTGAQVNALMNSIISNNVISNRNGDVNKVIEIVDKTSAALSANKIDVNPGYPMIKTNGTAVVNAGAMSIKIKAKSGATYSVNFSYNPQGYVSTAWIAAV